MVLPIACLEPSADSGIVGDMTGRPGPEATKADWRGWAQSTGEQIDWEAASRAVLLGLRDWPPLTNADRTLVFMPIANEIDLTPLREMGLRCEFLTTRTPNSGGDLTIHALGGPMEVHRFGFLQPHASAQQYGVDDITVFLIPGLAFDLFGNRLGRGAGYYDRLLANVRRGAFTVGVTSVDLVVDRLPTEAHDRKVRYLATEEGVVETAHG